MSGINKFTYYSALFIYELPKIIFVNILIGIALIVFSTMNLQGLFRAMIIAISHQMIYIAYRCTLSLEDIERKRPIEGLINIL